MLAQKQFLNSVKGLPRGTQLIMAFGEIDCREGILVSVSRDRYKDLAEGIQVRNTCTACADIGVMSFGTSTTCYSFQKRVSCADNIPVLFDECCGVQSIIHAVYIEPDSSHFVQVLEIVQC